MKKYQIIYADPPWSYRNKTLPGKRSVINKYALMTLIDICKLPIKHICADNCILFLWVTMPKLNECFEVIKAWGFKYKTCAFVWIKSNKRENHNQYKFMDVGIDDFMGMGRWTRANAELCLLATRGQPKKINANVKQIIYSPIRKHSQKPDEVRDRIIQLCGNLPRVELFAREKIKGWDVWGNEVECDIKL
jgi:N6-adenosine-specific RNA methylase IME4